MAGDRGLATLSDGAVRIARPFSVESAVDELDHAIYRFFNETPLPLTFRLEKSVKLCFRRFRGILRELLDFLQGGSPPRISGPLQVAPTSLIDSVLPQLGLSALWMNDRGELDGSNLKNLFWDDHPTIRREILQGRAKRLHYGLPSKDFFRNAAA